MGKNVVVFLVGFSIFLFLLFSAQTIFATCGSCGTSTSSTGADNRSSGVQSPQTELTGSKSLGLTGPEGQFKSGGPSDILKVEVSDTTGKNIYSPTKEPAGNQPKPGTPAPKTKPEPTGPQDKWFKTHGYVWNGKSWVKPPDGSYVELEKDQFGDPEKIRTPDGKELKKGDPGFDKAKDELEKQKNSDADKRWSEQVTEGQKADQEARDRLTAEIRKAQKEALEKMKDPDPNVQAQGRSEYDALKNGQNPAQQELKNLIDQQKNAGQPK